jgi:hypothetical protein
MTQLVLGFKAAGQVLVWVKVPWAGEMAKFVMLTADVPSLYKVMLIGALVVPGVWPGKLSLPGSKVMALVAPVPVSVMVWVGLPGSLSLRVNAALRVPAAVGVKLTVIVQFWPVFRVVGHVLFWEKSPLLAMLVKVTE